MSLCVDLFTMFTLLLPNLAQPEHPNWSKLNFNWLVGASQNATPSSDHITVQLSVQSLTQNLYCHVQAIHRPLCTSDAFVQYKTSAVYKVWRQRKIDQLKHILENWPIRRNIEIDNLYCHAQAIYRPLCTLRLVMPLCNMKLVQYTRYDVSVKLTN